ncbi:hypothetical protein Vqi01_41120 [Micromonospora qiuiae]|uniref:Uncharacterized protein n=1 Tax=Micromonospora qiuiae TaxID=502268 RepID=A0ABQ4JHL9_9ACTN|nr:hypothetical protein Vqi01_41120 [Micromonospora qiuiae]
MARWKWFQRTDEAIDVVVRSAGAGRERAGRERAGRERADRGAAGRADRSVGDMATGQARQRRLLRARAGQRHVEQPTWRCNRASYR